MTTGTLKWELGETAYTVVGDLNSGKTPLMTLHGGPGFLGKSCTTVAGYAQKSDRPAVWYDQIGCGASSGLKENPADFWQVDIFVKEFYELINHLGIADNFAINGHSWGGLLAAEIATTQPKGLKALVLSSPLGDSDTWVAGVKELLAGMPPEISSVIIKHEQAGTTTTDEYMASTAGAYLSGIKGSRWELFEESSHLSYVEEAAKYQRVMNEFLDSNC